MLKIHHNLFPHFSEHLQVPGTMQLSPVQSDHDELIQAIEEDHTIGIWSLEPESAESIESFWSGVERDIHNDPEWITFSDDEEEAA